MLSGTRQGLKAFDNQHNFERLAADTLNGLGYQDVEPMTGGPDRGYDIKFTEASAKGMAFVTLKKRIREILEDKPFDDEGNPSLPTVSRKISRHRGSSSQEIKVEALA